MATRKRAGAAKRTVAKQDAARKRSAPGKRFAGGKAGQGARARQDERKKVARLAHAARTAKRAEAARTAGHPKKKARPKASRAAAGPMTVREPALRASEEDAALSGAEVEPVASPARSGSDDPAAQTERASLHLLAGVPERTTPEPAYVPSVDVSDTEGAIGEVSPPPLGWALADLARSALGLVRTLVGVPFRIALAIPRFAIRAVVSV